MRLVSLYILIIITHFCYTQTYKKPIAYCLIKTLQISLSMFQLIRVEDRVKANYLLVLTIL